MSEVQVRNAVVRVGLSTLTDDDLDTIRFDGEPDDDGRFTGESLGSTWGYYPDGRRVYVYDEGFDDANATDPATDPAYAVHLNPPVKGEPTLNRTVSGTVVRSVSEPDPTPVVNVIITQPTVNPVEYIIVKGVKYSSVEPTEPDDIEVIDGVKYRPVTVKGTANNTTTEYHEYTPPRIETITFKGRTWYTTVIVNPTTQPTVNTTTKGVKNPRPVTLQTTGVNGDFIVRPVTDRTRFGDVNDTVHYAVRPDGGCRLIRWLNDHTPVTAQSTRDRIVAYLRGANGNSVNIMTMRRELGLVDGSNTIDAICKVLIASGIIDKSGKGMYFAVQPD